MRKKNRKLNKVRSACKSFGIAAIVLFQRAYQHAFGELDRKAARLAHTAYQRAKKIPKWVSTYIDEQFKLLFTGRAAPAQAEIRPFCESGARSGTRAVRGA